LKKAVLIINGPNLNLLGNREQSIYGDISFEKYLIELQEHFSEVIIDYFQSNHCGEIIDRLHIMKNEYVAVVLNAGGYTHNSISLADAIKAIKTPVIEVHISNIYARESFRKHSLLAPVAKASIMGMGLEGYKYAIDFALNL